MFKIGYHLVRYFVRIAVLGTAPGLKFQLLHGISPMACDRMRIVIAKIIHRELAQAGKLVRTGQGGRPRLPAPHRLGMIYHMPFGIAR